MIAECKSIIEAKEIRNKAIGLAFCAKAAKNKELEAHAIEIRMRATRRLGQMIEEQKKTVGLAKGSKGQLRGRNASGAVNITAPENLPTLASQGIDNNLAKQARSLAGLSDDEFKEAVSKARGACQRVLPTVVNGIDRPPPAPENRTPSVSPAVAILLDACTQLDEPDAVLAYVRSLRDPCDIVVAPEKFERAARSVGKKLAARQRARRRA
jgi:hypothetical protein